MNHHHLDQDEFHQSQHYIAQHQLHHHQLHHHNHDQQHHQQQQQDTYELNYDSQPFGEGDEFFEQSQQLTPVASSSSSQQYRSQSFGQPAEDQVEDHNHQVMGLYNCKPGDIYLSGGEQAILTDQYAQFQHHHQHQHRLLPEHPTQVTRPPPPVANYEGLFEGPPGSSGGFEYELNESRAANRCSLQTPFSPVYEETHDHPRNQHHLADLNNRCVQVYSSNQFFAQQQEEQYFDTIDQQQQQQQQQQHKQYPDHLSSGQAEYPPTGGEVFHHETCGDGFPAIGAEDNPHFTQHHRRIVANEPHLFDQRPAPSYRNNAETNCQQSCQQRAHLDAAPANTNTNTNSAGQLSYGGVAGLDRPTSVDPDLNSCYLSVSHDWLERMCRHLIGHMSRYGICVIDNFLGSTRGCQILEEVLRIYSSGKHSEGRLVSEPRERQVSSAAAAAAAAAAAVQPARSIRNDRVIWVDGCEEGCQQINSLIQTLCSVVTNSSRLSLYSNNGLDRVLINRRTKAHVACYPGEGTRYIKHVDNPNGDGRIITAIYYINKDWHTRRHGGLLRMFPASMDEVANIEPLFDRVLFFWSDRRNPHEVLPAYRNRFAITVWYMGESSRAGG